MNFFISHVGRQCISCNQLQLLWRLISCSFLPSWVSYLSCFWNQIPNKKRLTERRLILAHNLRGGTSWQGRHGGRSLRHLAILSRSREREQEALPGYKPQGSIPFSHIFPQLTAGSIISQSSMTTRPRCSNPWSPRTTRSNHMSPSYTEHIAQICTSWNININLVWGAKKRKRTWSWQNSERRKRSQPSYVSCAVEDGLPAFSHGTSVVLYSVQRILHIVISPVMSAKAVFLYLLVSLYHPVSWRNVPHFGW